MPSTGRKAANFDGIWEWPLGILLQSPHRARLIMIAGDLFQSQGNEAAGRRRDGFSCRHSERRRSRSELLRHVPANAEVGNYPQAVTFENTGIELQRMKNGAKLDGLIGPNSDDPSERAMPNAPASPPRQSAPGATGLVGSAALRHFGRSGGCVFHGTFAPASPPLRRPLTNFCRSSSRIPKVQSGVKRFGCAIGT